MISDFRLKFKKRNLQSAICNLQSEGFTLLEVMVAIAISSLVTMMLGELIVQGYKNYRITADQTTHTAIARRAQDTITKELREATLSERGDYPLITVDANALTFYSDSDRDSARERIRYWREGTLLKRGVIEPTGDPPKYDDRNETSRVVASYVIGSDPLFHYYNKNGVELILPTDNTNVTLIGITATIDVAPGILPRATTVSTLVQLRNIKANLDE